MAGIRRSSETPTLERAGDCRGKIGAIVQARNVRLDLMLRASPRSRASRQRSPTNAVSGSNDATQLRRRLISSRQRTTGGRCVSVGARAIETSSPALRTADAPREKSAHFVSAKRSRDPMISTCASPMLVRIPTCGAGDIDQDRDVAVARAPISTIATSCASFDALSSSLLTPISLFSLPGACEHAVPVARRGRIARETSSSSSFPCCR